MLRARVTVLLLFTLPTIGYAQDQSEAFFNQLQAAVRSGDRAAVASLVEFPVAVAMDGLRVPFSTAAAFVERYDDIFTREMREAVDRGDRRAFEVKLVNGRLKIVAMSVPRYEESAASSATDTGTRPVGRKEPRRIGVRAGPYPTQFAGNLGRSTSDAYMLFVPKGQLLEVRLERVGRAAIVQVTDARTGAPLNHRVARGALVVSGRAPSSGDYRIEVRHAAAAAEPDQLPYFLSVSVR
jgi:hypothetical protein